MNTLLSIMSKTAECGGQGANTGKLGCLESFGTPLSTMLTKRGFIIPKETVFDLDYVALQVQKGNFIPLIDASAFEDVSGEDSMSTNTKSVERINLQGLPKYRLKFEEGHEFYRQMSKLTSFKSKDAILIDDEGKWLMAINSNGDYTGLSLGQVNAELRKTKVQGGDAESKSLTMQFIDRLQFDYNYGIVNRESLGFTPQEVALINGVNLAFNAVPAATDVAVLFSAVLSTDKSTIIEGLVTADILVTVNGATVAGAVVSEPTPGNYSVAVPALALNDVVVLDLFDSALNVNVINSVDVLYRSEAISEIAVA